MVASIGEAAKLYSSRNFSELRKALAESSSTKERLEFAIQSAGDGYFEVDLDSHDLHAQSGPVEKAMLGFVPAGRVDREGPHPP
jgi:hypothetical protein